MVLLCIFNKLSCLVELILPKFSKNRFFLKNLPILVINGRISTCDTENYDELGVKKK